MKHAIEAAAAAMANARAARRGGPPVDNVLEVLPEPIRQSLLEDAEAALMAIPAELAGELMLARNVRHGAPIAVQGGAGTAPGCTRLQGLVIAVIDFDESTNYCRDVEAAIQPILAAMTLLEQGGAS